MYDWVVNTIGTLPIGSDWIYSIATLILYFLFIIMLCSPILIIFNIRKKEEINENNYIDYIKFNNI